MKNIQKNCTTKITRFIVIFADNDKHLLDSVNMNVAIVLFSINGRKTYYEDYSSRAIHQ